MADNENESSGRVRQSPGSKKRREPPIIDGNAIDISAEPSGPAEGDATPGDPTSAAEMKPIGTEEPVLFGQARRGTPPIAAEAESEPGSPALAAAEAPPEPSVIAVSDDAASTTRNPDDVSSSSDTPSVSDATTHAATPSEEPDPSVFGATGDDATPPPTSDSAPPFQQPPQARSSAATILGGIAVILLLVIAGLIVWRPGHGETDELRAAVEAADSRLAALEAKPDPSTLIGQVVQLDQRTSGIDANVKALKQAADDLNKRLTEAADMARANAAKLTAIESTSVAPAVGTPASANEPSSAGEAPAASAAALAALAGKVDDLTHKVAALPAEAAPAVDLEPLQSGIASLSRRLDGLTASSQQVPPASMVDFAPLEGKIADVNQRVDAIQAKLSALPKTDLGPLEGEIADLGNKLQSLDHGLKALSATVESLPKVDLGPLQAALATTEQRLKPIESVLAAPKAGDRVTEARAIGSADVTRAAPLAVVAQTAARSIDEGRPMVAEVEALRALGVDDATLAPLSAVAENGAPTTAALKARWEDVEPAVEAAIRPKTGNSLLDRFAAGARQIVIVRKVGTPAGDDPASLVARVSAALDDGDVAAAVSTWSKLPEVARTASQGFADMARSRLEATAAARDLAARAIETLAKAKG